MSQNLSELIHLLKSAEYDCAERPDPNQSVWRISPPGIFTRHRANKKIAYKNFRTKALSLLVETSGSKYIAHHEAPEGDDVPGEWKKVANDTWKIPEDLRADNREFENWLRYGGWTIYLAPAPASNLIDLHHELPAAIAEWLQKYSVSAIIGSFWDDIEWTVALTL